jgi:uncharacterized protein (DUF4415 family)
LSASGREEARAARYHNAERILQCSSCKGGRITIMIDDEVIEGYRVKAESAGRGYQTLMNEIQAAAV